MKSWLEELLPFAAMVMVECLDVGLTTLSKAAMTKGMSHFVFVVYSNALATLIFLPVFIFQRFFTSSHMILTLLIIKTNPLFLNGVFFQVTERRHHHSASLSYANSSSLALLGKWVCFFSFLFYLQNKIVSFIYILIFQDNCLAKLCICWCKLQLPNSWICYE